MDYKTVKYGKRRERRNYSRVKSNIELPNLIEVQTSSFEWFVQTGLRELFDDLSPITNFTENLELYFGEYELEPAKYTVQECKEKDMTFSRPLKVKVQLRNTDVFDKITGEVATDSIKEQKIFMGDIPMMSPIGSFIINGSERVIVSQIVRSSGVFFSEEIDKKTLQRKYLGQVIPTRGAWLEYEIGSKEILYAKIDRSKKISLSVMIRALGFSKNEQIFELFGEHHLLKNTAEKDDIESSEDAMKEVYAKIRQGETATIEGARSFFVSRLFDEKRYDLAEVGRFKINQKLDVITRIMLLVNRGADLKFANDIIDNETGEILFQKGQKVDAQGVDFLKSHRQLITKKVVFDHNLEEELKLHLAREARKEIAPDNYNDDFIANVVRDTFIEALDLTVIENGSAKTVRLIGNYSFENKLHITTSDILASISYYLNLFDRIGSLDDIDHLGNRRLRLIGELLKNQFRIGLAKMEKNVKDRMSTKEAKELTPQNLVNIRPLTSSLKEFFGSSQLSQFMQQTNPLDELTHKRRISALGPGGLTRDRAGFEVRDVHQSHYGRICPIETPEGQNIGLINSLACYVKVNKYGFMETPYLKIDPKSRKVTTDLEYLSADQEQTHIIAQANVKLNDDMSIKEERVVARYMGETKIFDRARCDYMDVSPKQIVSISTACIPFLEHDDANRALMGANMQRQAIPLLKPEAPFVGTGIELKTAHDSGTAVVALNDGVVEFVDGLQVKVRRTVDSGLDTYPLQKFMRSNQGTCINQTPIVKLGDSIKFDDIIADGPSMDDGELSLGRNVVVAFMTWNGYNYEDAVIMNERLVKEDVYTSIHIEKYEIEARDTKLGKEEITREIPNVGEDGRKYLDSQGIIIPGAEVKEGDILVGKVTPKGVTDPTPEDRLLLAIFGEKSREVRDTSLRVPHGGGGIVHSVKVFTREEDELSPGVNTVVRVYIVQKRKISEGDKMAGRHGNKGVISKILPSEDMPYLEDGTPVDIMLNPLGVPSRMNIGQVLEIHLGMAAKKLGIHVATPVFDGVEQWDLDNIMKEAGMDEDGKYTLYDGRTGEKFDNKVSVGVMYMIKLDHMVDDKLHARSVGPYTLVTQQPMGGKAQNGGQRFGEMEVWALEAYGAAYTLQEMLTVKSDDIIGRNKVFRAIVDGQPIPDPSLPESFRVLTRELRSLGIYVELINKDSGTNEVNKSLVDDDVEDYISKYGFQS